MCVKDMVDSLLTLYRDMTQEMLQGLETIS